MVHLRINEREANPNPHINFISVLDSEEDDAKQLMRALAAQVKPIMKSHGFTVNSFEEVRDCVLHINSPIMASQYEHNKVFAGRNWNNGEVIGMS